MLTFIQCCIPNTSQEASKKKRYLPLWMRLRWFFRGKAGGTGSNRLPRWILDTPLLSEETGPEGMQWTRVFAFLWPTTLAYLKAWSNAQTEAGMVRPGPSTAWKIVPLRVRSSLPRAGLGRRTATDFGLSTVFSSPHLVGLRGWGAAALWLCLEH